MYNEIHNILCKKEGKMISNDKEKHKKTNECINNYELNNEGITLIALVITIIVLLILARRIVKCSI